MAFKCSVCREPGHNKNSCPAKEKNNAIALDLQLKNRRYVLEAVNSVTALIQIPMVTAGVWFMLSRSNATLGVLNKAILAAELAPIIGDIKFPEGVVLGAAIESTEDLVNILHGAGLVEPWNQLKTEAEEKVIIPFGDILVPFLTPEAIKKKSCEELGQRVWELKLISKGQIETPEGVIADPRSDDSVIEIARRASAAVAFGFNLKAMKDKGCDRPTHPYYSPPAQWDAL